MPETPDEITALLRQAQAAEPVVGEFAWVWLDAFRRETREILEWHRRQGRLRVLGGESPDRVRREAEERLEAVRRTLKGQLTSLMAWARESGRASG